VVGICIHHGSSSRFSREKAVALFAKALEPLAVRSGARLLFLPHERVRGRASDIHLGRAIRHALPDPEQACIANARMRDREHLAAIRRCRLVVSSRYHGVVFALGGGVPVVGIADGDYTRTKLTGAFDLSSAPVRVVELDDPELPARLVRAWEEQEERRAEARRASSIARERLQESRDRLRTMIAAL
jgi:polysaccharide pyruvyl transferase WcaK-like protein